MKNLDLEFDKKFSEEWWHGFGTTKDINAQGIRSIKAFIRQREKELLQEFGEKLLSDTCNCYHNQMIKKKLKELSNE